MANRRFKHWQKQIFHLCLALCICLLIVTPREYVVAQSSPQGGIDWIVVLDTSGSMQGAGGTKDIFETVKNTVKDFVNQASVGDSVTLFTFDRDSVLRSNLTINSNVDRGNLKQIIDNLEANGQRTYTGKAIQEALLYSQQLTQRPNANQRTISILLFTDGLEDTRGIANPVSIPSNIDLVNEQNCQPYLFFVSLGEREHEKQLDKFVSNPALCQRGKVIRDPGANNLLEEGEKIRIQIQPPTEIKLIETDTLDLGKVQPGESSLSQTLKVASNVETKVGVRLGDSAENTITLIQPKNAIALSPNSPTSIPIQVQVSPNAVAEESSFPLILFSEDSNKEILALIRLNVAPKVTIEPQRLTFGQVQRGKLTPTQSLTASSNTAVTVKVNIDPKKSEITLIEPRSAIRIDSGQSASIPVKIETNGKADLGDRTFNLLVIPESSTYPELTPVSVEATLNITLPIWQKLLWPFLLLLLLIGIIIITIRKINFPGYLEGTLELLEPNSMNSGDSKIDLAKQKRQTLKISEILPKFLSDTYLAGSDAALKRVRQDGKKLVKLLPIQTPVIINDIGTSTDTIIYDGDIITIGAVKLKFSSLNEDDKRPSEINENPLLF